MPKTGIRSYETKTKGLRWLAYYHRDGKQILKRGFRTSLQAEGWRSEALSKATSPSESGLRSGWSGTESESGHRHSSDMRRQYAHGSCRI